MKKILTGLCALCALVACTREMPAPVSVPASDQESGAAPAASPVLKADLGIEEGVAIVYASESLASRWQADAQKVPSVLHARSVTRLFPHAGEWEPRTRKEGLHRWLVVRYDESVSYADAKECLQAVPGVQTVQPSRKVRRCVTPNDPYWGLMWGMNSAYDVNCKPVWDAFTMGSPSVTVAVIDGGIQLNHPDLAANVASGGHYNYVRSSGNIVQDAHGTHVAGTIAAVNNNGVGVTGVAGGNAAAGKPGVKLLSLEVFEDNPGGWTDTAPDFSLAIKEAADRGANIAQNSWGNYFDFDDNGVIAGYELYYAQSAHENPDPAFTDAVDYFNKYAGCDNEGKQLPGSPMQGGLVIFAAGNEDIPYGSPGNYDGCVSVGAISSNGSRAYFSNYGDWVDLCAPGVNVPSTIYNGNYASFSGTSMACPHVSGVAALVLSHLGGPGFTADELRARLLGGARTIPASGGSKPIGPLVDAYGAIISGGGGSVKPDAVESVELSLEGHNLRVNFAGTGAYAYMALAAKQASALENVDYKNPGSGIAYATQFAAASEEAGAPHSILLTGLTPSTQYYVAVVAYSYSQLYSDLSPIVGKKTAENRKPSIDFPDYPATGFSFPHYRSVNLPVIFSDPDGDPISVTFDARGGRAKLESNNGSQTNYIFKLMCQLVTPGTYQAVISAKDELGAQTGKTITYRVLENQAPVVVEEPSLVLLEGAGKTFELDVRPLFSDPDGEPLSYTASTRDRKVALAHVEDGILKVEAVAAGSCTVRISGIDHEDKRAEVLLPVVVKPEDAGEVFITGDNVVSGGEITVIPGLEEAPVTVRLISSAGVVVYEYTAPYSAANPVVLNVNGLAPGIYTLEVSYKEEVFTQIIVKR